MTAPFRLEFPNTGGALGVRVSETSELNSALAAMELHPPRPTLVVVGGAGGFGEADMDRTRALFESGIVPVMMKCGAVGVDGGTLAGVMRLFGEARAAVGIPLVGVVAAGTVQLPGAPEPQQDAAELEPHHTHFVIVPGDQWGAESPWIAQTATILADSAPSITVLINGGEIAYADVERSVGAGRSVVAVAGSGRTADEFAAALAGESADERAAALIPSGLIRSVPADQPAALAGLLEAILGEATAK
jgi:SLOG in TRPM, prokaryote